MEEILASTEKSLITEDTGGIEKSKEVEERKSGRVS